MPTATPPRMNSAAFALLTRLFAGLKRAGRITDVIWFQQNAEYARAVLQLAAQDDDEAVRKIGADLQELLRDFLAPPPPPRPVAATATGKVPTIKPAELRPAPVEETLSASEEVLDRYVGRLR